MFKLSTRSKYGLKACFTLARTGRVTSVAEIAAETGVSDSYLEQLFMRLKRAGIVESVRGAGGGYVLSGEPRTFTVGMIMRALDGAISVADCTSGECKNADVCPTRSIFKRLNDGIESIVDSVTLQDMADDYEADAAEKDKNRFAKDTSAGDINE